jgi:mannopine transport system permease protein
MAGAQAVLRIERDRGGHRYGVGLSLFLVAPLLVLLTGAFFYPIGRLLLQSVFTPEPTAENYAQLVNEPLFRLVFWRTFEIAALCTVLAAVLGYPVAWLMTRLGSYGRMFATACVMIPLWTSVLARSYAWVTLLQRRGIINNLLIDSGIISEPIQLLFTQGAVIIAMTHVLLPFMILPIYSSLRSIPDELTRAARNLGAGRWRAFAYVTLPLSLPGVFAGSLMVFILALGFYVTPAIVGGPSTLMLSTLIGQQMTILLNWPLAGALSCVLLVATLALVVLFRRFMVLGYRGA